MACILVIDDDDQMLNMLRLILERSGHVVLTAASGRQGLQACRKESVDLVITDVIMPDVEGLEVIMGLKREFPGMKIIAISGGGRGTSGTYLAVAEKFGAHRTLSKPFGREELLESVQCLVG